MGNFVINSSSLNNQYTFTNTSLIVVGNYSVDNMTSTAQNVSGNAYRKDAKGEQGDYIGNFNGYYRDGEWKYSLSEMTRQDANLVWDAIDEIQTNITVTNTSEE